MLFLYRPRQTWMPFGLPRGRTDQAAYNRRLQEQFQATQRVPAAPPAATPRVAERDVVADLEGLSDLRAAGALTDEEFANAKARVLGNADDPR
jgi:Short C-terminal domain